MGRVAAVTFLTEPKRRSESPAVASPPRPGQRQQRGAPVRTAPARPSQPGLPLAASRRRLSQRRAAAAAAPRIRPRRRRSGLGSRRGRCGAGQVRDAAGKKRCRGPLPAAAAPHAPFVPGDAAVGQEAPFAPSVCRGRSPFPCSSWSFPGTPDKLGAG